MHPTGRDLIADAGVDAVLVTSWAQTHEEHVLAAIDGGQAGVLREAARHRPQAACGDH